jgi:predicted dehydrogenase
MAANVTVALLGLGAINGTHQRILAELPGVRIGAVWDPLPERARAVAAQVGEGCEAWADHRELLTRAPVDCAYIAIPPHRHSDHEVLAARRDCPSWSSRSSGTWVRHGRSGESSGQCPPRR